MKPSFFLSYSRSDSELAKQLSHVLWSHGFAVWIDQEALPPGTPQWDRSIREALNESLAVIVLCSEATRGSEYVAIEIAIAQGLGLPIIPVWINGSTWTECAPVSLTLAQYADARPSSRWNGTTQLINSLIDPIRKYEQANSSGWTALTVSFENRSERFSPYQLDTWAAFLTEVYLSLCSDRFKPYTYGQDWALMFCKDGRSSFPTLLLPSSWALQPFSHVDENWLTSSVKVWPGPHCRDLRVVDAHTIGQDLRIAWTGVRAHVSRAELFARASHPKQVWVGLTSSRETNAHTAALLAFGRDEPMWFEMVVPWSEYLEGWQRGERPYEGVEFVG